MQASGKHIHMERSLRQKVTCIQLASERKAININVLHCAEKQRLKANSGNSILVTFIINGSILESYYGSGPQQV